MNGCAPEFALWSFVDLGYLTYYISYMLATGDLQGVEGETFEAGRMGQFTITKDPTRPDVDALRVLMGPFSIYNAENVEEAAGKRSTLGNCSLHSGRASRCAPAVCYRPCTPTTLPPGMWPSTSAPREARSWWGNSTASGCPCWKHIAFPIHPAYRR